MFSPVLILLIVYCGLIAVSSLCGGALPLMIRMTHTRMQVLVSAVGGFMLGVGIFHQLPHAVVTMPAAGYGGLSPLDWCTRWLMFGLLLTFFMLRMFHFHSHGPINVDDGHSHDSGHDHDHHHDHDHSHDHDHDSEHGENGPSLMKASWIGILLGLSLHTLLDGVALAAAVKADALHDHGPGMMGWALGIGTFLGVALHKPLDSMSITSMMAAGGWSRQSMKLVNIGYALMCPIGAGLFYFGIQSYAGIQDVVVAAALAMSAGVFLCISLSDLLPEVQFHSHDRLKLSAALLLGVAASWAIGLVEPAHTHEHQHDSAVEPDDHDHRHGDHERHRH